MRALNNELGPLARGKPEVVDWIALVDLVTRFKRLHDALKDKEFAMSVPGKWGQRVNPELTRRYAAVNQLLMRYRAVPEVIPDWIFTGPVDFEVRGWQLRWAREEENNENRYLELLLVQEIVKIAQARRISSIKQCEQCGRWIIARFSHQRFCPESACRDNFHRFNQADKERRRIWARNNYKTHRTKNVK